MPCELEEFIHKGTSKPGICDQADQLNLVNFSLI
jgi:hypothetical protein